MAYNIKQLLCQLEERRWCSCGLLLWYVGNPVSRIFACKGRARFAGRIRGKHSVDCVVCGREEIMTGNRSKVDDAVELWTRW